MSDPMWVHQRITFKIKTLHKGFDNRSISSIVLFTDDEQNFGTILTPQMIALINRSHYPSFLHIDLGARDFTLPKTKPVFGGLPSTREFSYISLQS